MENIKKNLLFVGTILPQYRGKDAIDELILTSNLKDEYNTIQFYRNEESYNGGFNFQNAKRIFFYLYRLKKMLKTQKIDFAYMSISANNLSFLRDGGFVVLVWWVGKPIIGHLHSSTFDAFYNNGSNFRKAFIRFILKKFNFLIVVSPYWHFFLSKKVSFPENKIRVIQNVINDDIYKNCLDRDYNKTSNISILFMGNIGKRKGTLDILKAIPKIIKQKQDIKFVFAGKEDRLGEMAQIKEICNKENLNPYVEFLGEIYGDNKINAFKESDIFLLPSYNEGFPITIIEAMSAGLPIVTTPVGGIPDVIKDRQSGLLIKPGDYNAIAENILLLINDNELRKKIGEQSRSIAKDNFLKDAYIKKIDTIFQEV